MRRRIIPLTLLILLIASPAHAQSTTTLKTFSVQLWAEHDQPSMLMIYTFEVADDTQLPVNIDIRLPKTGNITAVAFEDTGSLLLADYKNAPSDDPNWQVITVFVTNYTTYRVEYYQPLERDGNKRSFTFNWTGDYSVTDFSVEVRVPEDSTNVKTTPAIPLVQDQIFLTGGAKLNTMNEGDKYQLQLEYSRESDTPSLSSPNGQAVEPVAPVDTNTDGRVTLDKLPFVLGGFGVVLIAGALFYFLRSNSSGKRQKTRQRRRGTQDTTSQTYCHECGARAQQGDRFCRVCGSKLRT